MKLEAHQQAQRETAARLEAIGWPLYQAVLAATNHARDRYDAVSTVAEAFALEISEAALRAARVQYPLAAAYAMAKWYGMASNDFQAQCGRAAMKLIEGGAEPLATIQAMEANYLRMRERSGV